MLISVLNFIFFFGLVISDNSKLEWNIDDPYKYTGYIYTDSKEVIINPAIQLKINNNEEICNFYINYSVIENKRLPPFRAVVKSAHLGLGELILKPQTNLDEWRNKDITFSILAEACHDPDKWSTPAMVSIKVFDPPGPLWTQKSYSVVLNNNVKVGTTVVKVTAFLPSWTNVDNKICQYIIKSPNKSPFQIDGKGIIKIKKSLDDFDSQYITLVVVAEDCSQPVHRQSKVNVFISVNPICKLGWTGFYTLLKYKPGSGIKYLSKNPSFQLCDYRMEGESSKTIGTTIMSCIRNRTLKLTTSVEIKPESMTSMDVNKNSQNNCKLDLESLKLQREVCGINESKIVDLLIQQNRRNTGALIFPIPGNIFPVISLVITNKFSLLFWIKRDQTTESTEEYIICQIDDIGNNIFSVSLRKCNIRIQLKSYKNKYNMRDREESIPTIWIFSETQLCDNSWHHIVILASRTSKNTFYSELSVFIDGEIMNYNVGNSDIILNSPLQRLSSNMTDIFLGQCPKLINTEFKGVLAGVVLIPEIILKNSKSRCLNKCSERLYFNGMDQMNPGMSVSLNSEMKMIIINGHNIDEVRRLIKVIGFVNPSCNHESKERELVIETEMSCGKKTFRIPTKLIIVKVYMKRSTNALKDIFMVISLSSTVTTILIPDSNQANSDVGTGIIVFANTSLEISEISLDSKTNDYDVLPTVSKCVVTIDPKMVSQEYLDWPQHLLDSVSADNYSIKVTNTSKVLIFQGLHNQKKFQFFIQNLRYFSIPIDNSVKQNRKTFRLQCFSYVGKNTVKSNIVTIKVIIWYNNKIKENLTTTSPKYEKSTFGNVEIWKDVASNNTSIRNYIPLLAQSNVALMSELKISPSKANKNTYNIILGLGLVILICMVVLFMRRSRRKHFNNGCVLPYHIVDKICFPYQIIKSKIKPKLSVRVELSRNFINCDSGRRRDYSMERQWENTELKLDNGFNIISNPRFEKEEEDIDDSSINKDVPPNGEDEGSSTDDDIYEDFTEIYSERNKNINRLNK